jgi:L-2,4-diaminobutyric acid acetyltransferase
MLRDTKEACSFMIRKANVHDGKRIWRLVSESGKLDVNSPYCYIMLTEYFKDTCLVAEKGGEAVGFVSAFLQPAKPESLFVWQIAVAETHRGQGVADSLLSALVAGEGCRHVRFVEATVSPDNMPSRRLFEKLARKLGAPLAASEGFAASLFPGEAHENERLIRIGPILRH